MESLIKLIAYTLKKPLKVKHYWISQYHVGEIVEISSILSHLQLVKITGKIADKSGQVFLQVSELENNQCLGWITPSRVKAKYLT